MANLIKIASRLIPKARGNTSQCSSMRMSNKNSGPWTEICTSKEEREHFYLIGAESYQRATWPQRFIQKPEKRLPFLTAYFRYLFEEKVVNERAVLGAIKQWTMTNGKKQAETVYYGVYVYDTRNPKETEISNLLSIDKEATDHYMKRDEWLQSTIQTPMRKIAKEMGTEAWYLSHQVTLQKYKSHGYGKNNSMKLVKQAYDFKLEQQNKNGQTHKIPPFHYVISSDTFPGAFRLMDSLGFEMVGHYHYNYRPGLKCYLDPTAGNTRENTCNLLYVEKEIAPVLREKLKHYKTAD